MSKFCTNCGNRMEDTDRFCKICGTQSFYTPSTVQQPAPQPIQQQSMVNEVPVVIQQPPVAPVEPVAPAAPVMPEQPMAPVAVPEVQYSPIATAAPKKKSKKGLIITLSVVIVALIAIGCALMFVLPPMLDGDCTEALDVQIDVLFGECNPKEMAPDECWEALEDAGLDLDKYLEQLEQVSDMLYEQYGDEVTITYTVQSKEKLDKDDLDELKEEYEDKFDISPSRISAAYEIEYEMLVDGDIDSESVEEEIIVIKIDGEWYPYFELTTY